MLSKLSSRYGKRCLRMVQRRSNQSAATSSAEFEEPKKSPSQILNRYDSEDAFLLNDQLTEEEIMVKVRRASLFFFQYFQPQNAKYETGNGQSVCSTGASSPRHGSQQIGETRREVDARDG